LLGRRFRERLHLLLRDYRWSPLSLQALRVSR
jgi:hypothetical protein